MLSDLTFAEINAGVVALLRSNLKIFHKLCIDLKRSPDEIREIADRFDRAPLWLIWKIADAYDVSIDRLLSGWVGYDGEAMQVAVRETLRDALPELDASRGGLTIHRGPYRFSDRPIGCMQSYCDSLAKFHSRSLHIAYMNALDTAMAETEEDEASGLYDPWATPTEQPARKPRRRAKTRRG